jgi:hypothetical protein
MLDRIEPQIIQAATAIDNQHGMHVHARGHVLQCAGCHGIGWEKKESRRMSGQHDKLRSALEQLQGQLDEMRAVDPGVAAHLDSTIDQAKAVLAGRPTEEAEQRSLSAQLKDAVLKYEVEHPTLAGSLGSVIDALGQMGI